MYSWTCIPEGNLYVTIMQEKFYYAHENNGDRTFSVVTDPGKSFWSSAPVAETLIQKLPISFELGILALIISSIIAFPVGIYSAMRPETKTDYLLRSFAIALIALPSFWLGTMIMIYPSIWWNCSPRVTYISFGEDPLANLGMFCIPAILMGMWLSGVTMRLIRTTMLEVLRQDYVRTAWAKGLRERVVMLRHVVRNMLIPVVSQIGLQLPVLIRGSIVVEQIFALPGLGSHMVEAVNRRDYPVISGINLLLAGFVLIVNLITDLSYAWLDPRIQYR